MTAVEVSETESTDGALSQDRFTIRAAVEEDVPLILDFVRALARFEKLSDAVVATPEQFRAHLFGDQRRAEIALACVGGRPAGFAIFFHTFSTFLGQPGLYLEDLFITPEHRGKGLGRALMIHLAQLARERGCGRFEWAVLDWNSSALDFYRSLGAESKREWVTQRVSGGALEALAARPLFPPTQDARRA